MSSTSSSEVSGFKRKFTYTVRGVPRSGSLESAACTAMCWLRRPGVPAASTRRRRSMLSGTLSPCPKTAMKHRRSSDALPRSSPGTRRHTRSQPPGQVGLDTGDAGPPRGRSSAAPIRRAPDRARGREGRRPRGGRQCGRGGLRSPSNSAYHAATPAARPGFLRSPAAAGSGPLGGGVGGSAGLLRSRCHGRSVVPLGGVGGIPRRRAPFPCAPSRVGRGALRCYAALEPRP